MLKNYFYMAGKQRFCDEITWLDVLMQHLRHNRINPSELRWLIFIYIQYREMMIQKSHPSSFLISKKFKIVLVKRVYKICNCGGSKVGHFGGIRKILVYQIAYFILFLLNIRYFILRLSSEQKTCFWKGFLNFPLHFNFNFKLE